MIFFLHRYLLLPLASLIPIPAPPANPSPAAVGEKGVLFYYTPILCILIHLVCLPPCFSQEIFFLIYLMASKENFVTATQNAGFFWGGEPGG